MSGDVMPKEQYDFIKGIQDYMLESTNMKENEAWRFGFCVWQSERWLRKYMASEVSEDCISRKWIMSRIRSEYLKWLEDYDIDQILGDIEDAPSVIPKAKEGEWKSKKASIYPYGYDVECSVCGHRMGSSFGYKFCPNCGAKMKGASDD